MKQNYTTIDTCRIAVGKYIKISSIDSDPKPHYVVAEYSDSGSEAIGDHCVSLIDCWHFVGPTAELDSMDFFCSMVPELKEDFPSVNVTSYSSYRE